MASSENDDTAPAHSADPGWIGSSTLVPTKFSTGSYGWKGSKKVTIEVVDTEDPEKKVKVQVNISCVSRPTLEQPELTAFPVPFMAP
jgi:hypothetical protein